MSEAIQCPSSAPADAEHSVHCRICPLCEAHCGTLVTIDRASHAIIGVRGDPDDPFSKGYICAKAYAMKELHHDPDVIKTPLIKRNGRFEPASWSEALDYTAGRIRDIQSRHGNDSVGFYIGNPTAHHPGLLLYSPLLLEALASRQVYCAGSVDHITKVLSSLLMYGDCSVMTVPDIDRTELFVVHGGNPAVSNGSLMTAPGMPKRIKAVRSRGGKVVVIDPRRTETAELADEHIPIRPGTDAYFLFGILHHLFASKRVNLGSVASFAKGLDTVRSLASELSPEDVAGVCGVPAETIRRLASDFANAGSAVWYGRTGTCTQRFGTLCCWLQDLINILTGNLDRPGGAMFPVGIVPAILYAEKFQQGMAPFGRWHSRVHQLPELSGVLPTAAIADEILTPGEGQVRAFITMAGNPVLSHPNGERLSEALGSLEFMLSLDIYVNETTRHADVILPSPSEATHSNFHFFYIPFMVRRIARWNAPLFEVPAGQLHDWEIFQGLVARLRGITEQQVEDELLDNWIRRFVAQGQNASCPDIDATQARAAVSLQAGPDRLFDVLVRTGAYGDAFGLNPAGLSVERIAQCPHGLDLGGMEPQLPGLLATPDRLIDLAPQRIVADVTRLKELQQDSSRTDSLLLIGRRHTRSNNSWMHNLNVLTKGKDRCTLMINPLDAQRLGLSNGQIATVSTAVASLRIPVEITEQIMPGVVSIPHGWGHNAAATNLTVANRHAGANANALIDETLFDAPSINSMLNGIPVRVAPDPMQAPCAQQADHSPERINSA
jgi:anaerobic selenocysteine-containing dehydrogenase